VTSGIGGDSVTTTLWVIPHFTDLGHDHVRFVLVPVTEIRDMCGRRPGEEVSGKIDGADRVAGRGTAYCRDLSGAASAHGVVLTEETSC